MKRKDNPAKIFLRRYRSLSGRVDALNLAINQALERAGNISVQLKQVSVLSSPAESDPMARDVCEAVDACAILYQYKAEAEKALKEIMEAIESVQDERQKAVLTMRYINGEQFLKISEKLFVSEPAIYIAHGRALLAVNRWMNAHGYGGEFGG